MKKAICYCGRPIRWNSNKGYWEHEGKEEYRHLAEPTEQGKENDE